MVVRTMARPIPGCQAQLSDIYIYIFFLHTLKSRQHIRGFAFAMILDVSVHENDEQASAMTLIIYELQ